MTPPNSIIPNDAPAGSPGGVGGKLLHILRHSLGLDDNGRGNCYRNSFVTGSDSKDFTHCRDLVERGLMTDHGPQRIAGGMHCFTVTGSGKEISINREPLPRVSQAKRRYRAFLSLSDVCPDLTFRAFLTEPQFEEARSA